MMYVILLTLLDRLWLGCHHHSPQPNKEEAEGLMEMTQPTSSRAGDGAQSAHSKPTGWHPQAESEPQCLLCQLKGI